MTTATTATRASASTPASVVPDIAPLVEFPPDQSLPLLTSIFEPEWVSHLLQERHGRWNSVPSLLQVREFSHSRGRTAQVTYEAHWPDEEFLPSEIFTIKVDAEQQVETVLFPYDDRLPGLATAADPEGALSLVNRYVLAVPARRTEVELVRYRAGNRAVLRQRVGRARFFARAMRPEAVQAHLASRELIIDSDFVVPRLAGVWNEGAVIWMSEIPGRSLRTQIRRSRAPDPIKLLNGLQSIWDLPVPPNHVSRFSLTRAYRRARRGLLHESREDEAVQTELGRAVAVLDPFVEAWRPSGLAHNDFYDDQLLTLRDGRISMVDFEEAGPGDPMLDVGNFLAHLRWAVHLGRSRYAQACDQYHSAFREAALERWSWNASELDLREAVCLFRVCTNSVRHPRADWQSQLRVGLGLVNEVIGSR